MRGVLVNVSLLVCLMMIWIWQNTELNNSKSHWKRFAIAIGRDQRLFWAAEQIGCNTLHARR